MQQDRQDWRDQNREDWQDYGNEHQQDRQDYINNYDDYYHDDHHGYYGAGVVAGAMIGSALTAAQFNTVSSSCSSLTINGLTYYRCGSTWYQPAYKGDQVTFIVVTAPQ
jgi:hypothetical protein